MKRSALLLLALALAGCGSAKPSPPPIPSPTPPASLSPTPTPPTPTPTPSSVYAHTGAADLSPATKDALYRLYVPESGGSSVDVIDPSTMKVVDRFPSGRQVQHVVPSYDLTTLYATNDLGNSLTPIDPTTARPKGPTIPVADPYNMYFTPDGSEAVVVAEAQQRLDFYDAHTFALHTRLPVDCKGVDHADVTMDGHYFLASCEFSSQLVLVDLTTHSVVRHIPLSAPSGSSMPQDVRISPDGSVFFVADMAGGVHVVSASSFAPLSFIPTAFDAHGLYPSRDGLSLYVTNRRSGTISVLSFASQSITSTWHLPPGATPDMGGVSPDGTVLFLSGRYSDAVYAISTQDGHLLASIPVPHSPHGLCVWPQPGRYSLGHTGNMR